VVLQCLSDDIQQAAGPMQTCTGLRSGIEATIHAVKQIWDEEDTEAVLLIDADNAFNSVNRRLGVHNIRQLCPPFHRYLHNTYQSPADLYVNDGYKTESILSDEGCTQGDVAAMAFYALSIQPLTIKLASTINPKSTRQMWYADDGTAVGKLAELKIWWDKLCEDGPLYGYYPNASKTVLIVKDATAMPTANCIFGKTGIKITSSGERHLGAVVGTEAFRTQYVNDKINKWIKDIEELSKIAQEEPQAALSGYTKVMCHRWTFIQRTIENVEKLFQPLEDTIRHKFIPSIVGREVSDLERRMIALPVRCGGLGISNPVVTANKEYAVSKMVTDNLTKVIISQDKSLENYAGWEVNERVKLLKAEKETNLKNEMKEIAEEMDGNTKRCFMLAQEKGAGSWLTVLPIHSLGYTLNKEEFLDSIRLRYGWLIPNIPSFCVCEAENTINHALTCKTGGQVIFRHNKIRDVNAEFLRQACYDVQLEPGLLPIENKEFRVSGINTDQARLDISARGLWSPFQKSMFDVRIFHPNAKSYSSKPLNTLYKLHENLKKRDYGDRVRQREKASFTPLVYSTHGGMATEAEKFHKRLGKLISEKRKERYADVIGHMRAKLRFTLLRSVLVSLRGARGRDKHPQFRTPLNYLEFGLIPEADSYESPM